jgi:hypothetical protein
LCLIGKPYINLLEYYKNKWMKEYKKDYEEEIEASTQMGDEELVNLKEQAKYVEIMHNIGSKHVRNINSCIGGFVST